MDNTKTAPEEPNAERILFTKIIEASPGENFIDIQDEINNVANDPGHAIVLDAMHEYANQVSAPLKKRIEELERVLSVVQGSLKTHGSYPSTVKLIDDILNPSTNGK